MGRVVGVVLSVHVAEEFWAMVPERRIVPVPTHGLVTVHTEASLLFESRMRCWCFEIFWDTTIVLGEKYDVEWGNGIPIPTTWRLWDFDIDEPNVLFPFRELIGALLWIALLTRPDIANAVRAVARYCSAPKLIHWKAARSILGYAVRTSSFGIYFQKGTLTGLV